MTTELNEKPRGREAQRLETRQRVYDAAIAEFKRSGVADADIGAIVSAAGVARGTFYFHFPTKEHVLEDVERNLVKRLAADLARFLESPHDLWSVLSEVVRLVTAGESRLGVKLFRDVLALHFSQTRPPGFGKSTDHPLVALVATEIRNARDDGTVHAAVDPPSSALFFLLGVYSLLVTNHEPKPARARVIDEFVASTRRGLEAR
jgi:AcrR family transcriptional regulator